MTPVTLENPCKNLGKHFYNFKIMWSHARLNW